MRTLRCQPSPESIRRLFTTKGDLPNVGPNWNVAPTQPPMVTRRHLETSERRLDVLRSGAALHQRHKACKRPINARSETAGTSGMFSGKLAARRCLVPADAFYEWKAMADGKQPYAIARVDGAPIAFAGLWEGWRDPAGETLRTFSILITAADDDMSRLNDRMPVILEAADWPVWLGEEVGDHLPLLRPSKSGLVRLWPVSRAVTSVRKNGAELLDCIDDPAAPPDSGCRRGTIRLRTAALTRGDEEVLYDMENHHSRC